MEKELFRTIIAENQEYIGKMIEMSFLDNYKRVVIKIGSSTLTHAETGSLNFSKSLIELYRPQIYDKSSTLASFS